MRRMRTGGMGSDLRLALLLMAILAGLAVQKGRTEHVAEDPCEGCVEAVWLRT